MQTQPDAKPGPLNGITVIDLVSRGRFPYQGIIRQWTDADEQAVLTRVFERVAQAITPDRPPLSGLS